MIGEIAQMGGTLAKTTIGNRVAFAAALSDGRAVGELQPRGRGAAEIKALAKEILRRAK